MRGTLKRLILGFKARIISSPVKLQEFGLALINKANERNFKAKQNLVRPKLRMVLDTQVRQLLADERIMEEQLSAQENSSNSWPQKRWFVVRPNHKARLSNEVDYLAAICELARKGEIEFVQIPSISSEMLGAKNTHAEYHGTKKLDHGIQYLHLNGICPRIKFTPSYIINSNQNPNISDCLVDVGRHSKLLKHIRGKKQTSDLWHYIVCDSFGIDVFLTADDGFIKAFRQVEENSNLLGTRTKVYSPKEFAQIAGVLPIEQAKIRPAIKQWRFQ
ncbi:MULTISPECIES: hypothetical protein [Lentibacter]|uniref:Uncharacterized protein n=2 Tax=Lentibacter algarum TaxID=576131 RepID=A0A1H3I7Y7_9RHOB|nr:hypothetical protein [Lentibacter algarum]MCO4776263.1 hypothetical protein [Lentibacter algarum]MCO4828356.1 hypothetical protein [Lentibacter algarum]WIF31325.1 hypothetical protein LentiSH36_00850 [Lentibacter algarum]SDY23054.1 hypothetical protein SAMN05444486_101882 [Lentibacter algarum]